MLCCGVGFSCKEVGKSPALRKTTGRVQTRKGGPMGTSAPTEGDRTHGEPSVPGLMRYLKRSVTHIVGQPVWQRSYHDHVIRNEADYLRIWSYIDTNPAKWREDCYFTETEES